MSDAVSIPLYNRKSKRKEGEAIVDKPSASMLKNYTYFKDSRLKPYRIEKSGNRIETHFLCRDIFGCRRGDNRTVRHVNGDVYDCRRNNLMEGPSRKMNEEPASTKGYKWPQKLSNLKNFLEQKNTAKTLEAYDCLDDAIKCRYSRKNIHIVFDSESKHVADDKAKADTRRLVKTTLLRYFDLWDGDVSIGVNFDNEQKKKQEEAIRKRLEAEAAKGTASEEAEAGPKSGVNESGELASAMPDMQTGRQMFIDAEKDQFILKKCLWEARHANQKLLSEILRDPIIFTTEDLVRELKERGAQSVVF